MKDIYSCLEECKDKLEKMKRKNKVEELELEDLAKKFKLKRKIIKDDYYFDNRREKLQENARMNRENKKILNTSSAIRSGQQIKNERNLKNEDNLKLENEAQYQKNKNKAKNNEILDRINQDLKEKPKNPQRDSTKKIRNASNDQTEKKKIAEKLEENKEKPPRNLRINFDKQKKNDDNLKIDPKPIIEQLKLEINEAKSQKNINKAKYDEILEEVSQDLKYDLKKLQTTDICFVLDVTSSMQKYINLSINSITKIIKKVRNVFKNSEINMSLVCYRDVDYSEQNRFEIINFTTDYLKIEDKLKSIDLIYGKDICEDINGALQEMLKLTWKSENKMVFHILDSPCHNIKYNGLTIQRFKSQDHHPSGFKNDRPFEEILEKCLKKKIQYYILYANRSVDAMIENFRKIYIDLKNLYDIENMFIAQKVEEDIDNFIAERTQTIVSNVSKSVFEKITFKPIRLLKKNSLILNFQKNDKILENKKVFLDIELCSGEIPDKLELFQNLNDYAFNVKNFYSFPKLKHYIS